MITKLDYSKSLNEQPEAASYYKNRYLFQSYYIMKLENIITKTKEKIRERIAYCKGQQSEDEWECCIEELGEVYKILTEVNKCDID